MASASCKHISMTLKVRMHTLGLEVDHADVEVCRASIIALVLFLIFTEGAIQGLRNTRQKGHG
jgi:hypothetical protein